jgi:hypothetical protein
MAPNLLDSEAPQWQGKIAILRKILLTITSMIGCLNSSAEPEELQSDFRYQSIHAIRPLRGKITGGVLRA